MTSAPGIASAAKTRDWHECGRLMFALLFHCRFEEQCDVASQSLERYLTIWNSKHPDWSSYALNSLLARGRNRPSPATRASENPALPEFPHDLDPADAEFENAVIGFYKGLSYSASHSEHTMNFATAIRSAIVARQVDRWLRDHPREYAAWRSGKPFSGPTFLDDDNASAEAEDGWISISRLLEQQPSVQSVRPARRCELTHEVAAPYRQWEALAL